ncbi:precorrin-2 C(20)-methyltransferase [Bacillota bacterium LX-D]|nr:precorrin-2 C(20)-methyltransferase [Bacillota bacterium LX-D]
MKGKFIGIGIGPGDPELLTLKAIRLIQETKIICVPKASKEKESVALKIIGSYLTEKQTIVELIMPMTKNFDELKSYWNAAAETILDYLRQGQNVVCVTLGDASLYSTYLYVQQYIATVDPEIIIETIPGITSFAAAAAQLNISLAEGNEKLAIIPAVENVADLEIVLDTFSNIILMKVSGQFEEIIATLEKRGILNQSILVSRCGQPEEKIEYDLAKMKGQKPDYLSLILIKQGGKA